MKRFNVIRAFIIPIATYKFNTVQILKKLSS